MDTAREAVVGRSSSLLVAFFLLSIVAVACGGDPETDQGALVPQTDFTQLPYAAKVVSFTPGSGAGFGQDKMPSVVLGPPDGSGTQSASIDVLSLGVGGEIVLDFSHRPIIDGPGPDLTVFENVFWANNNPSMPFVELGEVSVSSDGQTWFVFECKTESQNNTWPGCAGWHPTLAFDPKTLPLDPEKTGGDSFDLASSNMSEARFVRIRDLATSGEAPTAGFDLDAVGVINTH